MSFFDKPENTVGQLTTQLSSDSNAIQGILRFPNSKKSSIFCELKYFLYYINIKKHINNYYQLRRNGNASSKCGEKFDDTCSFIGDWIFL